MTIAPSDCPLDLLRQAPDPRTPLALHTHTNCDCLDRHDWQPAPGPIGSQECTECRALRCAARNGAHRCTRRASHRGGRHLAASGASWR